jgi:GGDEF domain-containing protein
LKLFDNIERGNLERRELQLWVLAITTILILSLGLVLLMYPAVFSHPVVLAGKSLRVAFFGFCVLSMLLLGYLLDRRSVVRQLRRQIKQDENRIVKLRLQASADLLSTLPNWIHFQDRLTMEFRRVAHLQSSLSILSIQLIPSPTISDQDQLVAAEGDAAKAISRKLRREDSLYRFCSGCFGIIMPGLVTAEANRTAERLKEGLDDAAGISIRFSSTVKLFNYPEHAATAQELEQAIHSLLPEDPLGVSLLEVQG